ncbi:hypothetical protein [Chamaesiphon polymorphus]|nr:hypothetical protein [Chamaesiphon polymorphus]
MAIDLREITQSGSNDDRSARLSALPAISSPLDISEITQSIELG